MKTKKQGGVAGKGAGRCSGIRSGAGKAAETVALTSESGPAVTHGSGNVYRDMGLPDAEERFEKSILAIYIKRAIGRQGITQQKAGELMGIDQSKVSAIVNGRLEGFSSDRLLRFLNDLGCDVEISVSEPNAERRGRLICS